MERWCLKLVGILILLYGSHAHSAALYSKYLLEWENTETEIELKVRTNNNINSLCPGYRINFCTVQVRIMRVSLRGPRVGLPRLSHGMPRVMRPTHGLVREIPGPRTSLPQMANAVSHSRGPVMARVGP